MFNSRSPPKYKKLSSEGSNNRSTNNSNGLPSPELSSRLNLTSTSSLSSAASTEIILTDKDLSLLECSHKHSQSYRHHHHHQNYSQRSQKYNSKSTMSSNSQRRGRKHNWGPRERTGMSFLIVVAFFAIFGLIILTEVSY